MYHWLSECPMLQFFDDANYIMLERTHFEVLEHSPL